MPGLATIISLAGSPSGNWFLNVPISQGIPAIAIGAGGRGGDAHTHGEWYDNVHGGSAADVVPISPCSR